MNPENTKNFRIGLISDTHGVLGKLAVQALQGVDEVWHAGDHGNFELLEYLGRIAPLEYVSGNIDNWEEPLTVTREIEGHKLHMLHRLSDLAIDPVAEGISLVIYGHSHKPALEVRDGVTYLNPGAAGKRRFSLPIAMAMIDFPGDGTFEIEFINLGDDRPLP